MWSGLARAPLIFADEAHHTLTIERFHLLESRFSPEALRVALTATPDYDEARALCRFFPRLMHELPLEDALDLGLMAPLRVWVLEVDADASGVRVVAGDYEDATLGSVMGSQLFLDATLRLRYAPANRNTRALVTCRIRAQAHQLAHFFERHQPAGAPRVGLILGDTRTDQRKQLLADFEAGAVDTLVQVGVRIEGWDSAVCKVLIDLSASLSLVRSAQKYFRVLTAHGEREARIYVLLPTGLSGLPMLPNDLFGASLRHYECGALIGPERSSDPPSSALVLPPLERVRARPKLVHHARLERPLLPRGARERPRAHAHAARAGTERGAAALDPVATRASPPGPSVRLARSATALDSSASRFSKHSASTRTGMETTRPSMGSSMLSQRL